MSATDAIVVAVDGSEAASNAVAWAARAAAAHQRRLHIVTAVHIPAFYYSEPYLARSFQDELHDTARARLDSAHVLAKQSAEDLAPIEITTEELEGRPAPLLIDLSKQAWMVVLGSHGHGEITGLSAR